MDGEKRYVSALGYRWLTKLYDPVVALMARERAFKNQLVRQADVQQGGRVLDIGCGTGTLAIMIKRHAPGACVTGLDGDRDILELARRKSQKAGVDVEFTHGFSMNLPYDDASFDCVFSSLFFHHLLHEDKTATIGEMFRVLKPCGEFHAADWGKPRNAVMRTLFYTVQLIDGFEYTRENVQGRLPVLFSEGGFTDVRTRREFQTVLGTMTLYSGKKPSHIS